MSYVNIEIGGKARGLKFNQMAVIVLAQKCDQENYAATAAYAAVWAGLKANAYVKGEELDMTFEEVCEAVDIMTPEDMAKINSALEESEAYKKLIPEEKEQPKKKPKSTPVSV